MKHQILALAVAALSFTACTNEDNISQDFLADTPIKLNVSVDEPTTRAGYSDEDKPTGFALTVNHNNTEDDKYNYVVWAKKVGDNWKTYKLVEEPWGGTDEEVTMLWANMNDKVEVTAFTKFGDITIPTGQTSDEQLKQADVLYMPTAEYDPKLCKDGITVNLQHAMSKINLTIELGSEYEFSKEDVDLKIKDVKIDGSLVSGAPPVMDNLSGDPTPITPLYTGAIPFSKDANGVITKASATYEAILFPQTIASGKFTVSFKVDGKLYEWAYNNEAGLTLASNTAYTLKLIAGDDKVQPVSFSVAAWNAGNGENGEEKETD